MMIERTDREEKISPADIICPPEYYDFSSPYVSEVLAFTVERKFGRLKVASESLMSSTEDSYEEFYNINQLAKLTAQDPRLSDQLDSKVVTRLVQFLERKKYNITYYAAVILSNSVLSRHGSVVRDETIPRLLNLIPCPDMFSKIQALITLIEIANAYPDSCDTMIKNGVLDLLESLLTDKENNEVLLQRAAELLTTLCRMKQQLPSDMKIKVISIISTAIVYDSEDVLIQICLLISILSDRRFLEIGFEVIRLLDLIDHPVYMVVISALRTIGNYVRWGNDENIQFLMERGLLLHLKKVLCHEYTIVRKEACWIISNITAVANNSNIQEVIGLGLIDMLIRLLKTDEFEVKEVAACAIFNAVSGSNEKQFAYIKENCFPLVDEGRCFCHEDGRVVNLCSKILQLDNIGARMTSATTADLMVASKVDFISDITPMKETWKIRVQIVRLWKIPSLENPSNINGIEMVLMDEKGSKISAYVKKSLVNMYSPLLMESQYRSISTFGVGQNTGYYKTTQHPFKINFLNSTSVSTCENLGVPLFGFSYVSFDDIKSNKLDDTYLIDVIGEIISDISVDQIFRRGKLTKRTSFEIRNLEGQTINCTLWDSYAEQLAEFVAIENPGPTVIIIQFGKRVVWKGKLCIQNSMFSTRLFINNDIDDILNFKKNVKLNKGSLNVKPTQLSTQSSRTINEDFLHGSERKTLYELGETNEVTHCVTLATITCINTEGGWFYLSCNKCARMVKETEVFVSSGVETKNNFFCGCCGYVTNVIPRYKVEVRVVDETGSASFVMFDSVITQLLNKSAYDLRESLLKKHDVHSFPEELEELLERKFLFKINILEHNIKMYWPYTVKELTDDEQLIKSFTRCNADEPGDASFQLKG